MHTGQKRAILAAILGLVLAACVAVPSWAVADEASPQAGTQTVEVDYTNVVVIKDAGSGKLTISGARSGNGTVDASTQIVLTSHDKASQDAFVRVEATASTVNLTFDTLKLRPSKSQGSPLELAGDDSGSGGSNVVLTLEGGTENILDSASGEGRAGISVPKGASLTIQGTGSLVTYAAKYAAAIGGDDRVDSGDITINGGTIEAIGVTSFRTDTFASGAAIGGGRYGSSYGTITITGGTVTATGSNQAAGLGGGAGGTCGVITITGGTVDAEGGPFASGIGSGHGATAAIGTIDISGGAKVTAIGCLRGAGIGSGEDARAGGTVHISGAGTEVMAEGGHDASIIVGAAGIGGGYKTGGCDVTIEGGASVTATGGYNAAGIGSGTKAPSSPRDLTVRGDDTRVLAEGGNSSAGIGTGYDATRGGIVRIEGGLVVATGYTTGAGIGGGYETSGSTVIVTGGTVVARSGDRAASGIGSGAQGEAQGTLTITGGSVLSAKDTGEVEALGPTPTNGTSDLTRYVVALEGVADDTKLSGVRLYAADGTEIPYGQTTMWTTGATYHDGNSALYLYLPKGCDLGRVSLADGTTYLKKSVSGEGYLYGKASYTVTFDKNATDATGTMADETLDWGVPTALTKNAFTRSGYTFLGWSKTKGATKADYSDAQSVTKLDDDPTVTPVTLYAVWAQLPDAILSYTSSDVTAGTCTPGSETVAATAAAGTAAGSTAAPVAGHHFTGWTTYGSATVVGTGTTLAPAQVDAVARRYGVYATTAFVANFAPNTYKVEFDKNATDATGTMADETGFLYGTSKDLTANGYSRPGYTFAGWNTKADGSGATYADRQSVLDLAGKESDGDSVVLYARWAANADVTLSYVPDDAAHGSCSPAVETLPSGSNFHGSEATALTGYHFDATKGWTDDSDTTVSTSAELDLGTATASATYTAHFTGNTYYVDYDAGAGSGAPARQTMTYGTSEPLTSASDITRDGYAFLCWKVKGSNPERFLADGSSVSDLATGEAGDTSVTLEAVWGALPDAVVSYVATDPSGVTRGSCEPASQVVGGSTSAVPDPVTLTADSGYHLDTTKGWTWGNLYGDSGTVFEADGTTPVTSSSLTTADIQRVCLAEGGYYLTTRVTANMVANTYSVSFDANGGGGTMADQGMTYGQAATLDACTLARAGYTFAGWNTAADGSGTSYADGDPVSDLTTEDGGTVPLYAQWRQTYATLSYEASGSGTTDPELEVLGAATGTPLGSYAEADTGHHLVGWTWANASGSGTAGTSPELTPAQVAAVAKASGLYVDTTFTATFAANAYTVTFDAAGGSGTMSPQRMTYGEDAALEANSFSWAGHRFVGWSTEAGGTTATYDDGETVSDLTAEDGGTVELHAVWADATQSVIGYGAGEGGSVSPSSEVVGGTDAAVGSTATAADGYRFVAWVDAGGNVVSTDATFVPARPLLGWADATYTATFAKGDEPVTPDTPDTPTSPDVPGSTAGSGTSGTTATSARAVPSTGDPTLPVVPLAAASLALLGAALVARCRRA